MDNWLKTLPKAELHLHIEGTLEPELMFALAARNGVQLPYRDVTETRAAYNFTDLQSFLDLYYQGMSVLHTVQDFHDLALDYFRRAHEDGVVHVELSFDPQAHLKRDVSLATQFDGLGQAMQVAEQEFGMSTALIMSFLRDESADSAMQVLEDAAPWYDGIASIGLDSAELGNPPEKFEAVYARARELGIPRTAHAGEEGSADYITNALDILDVSRIDHGIRCLEDPELVARLRTEQIPLTVCPLSNLSLHVVDNLADHPLPKMVAADLNVNLNSDDPAYFGGGMLTNFRACADAFGWGQALFRTLASNGVEAAFMAESRRRQLLAAIANH